MPDLTYPGPESITRLELDNGLVLLIYEKPNSESVVIEGLVRCGSLVETRENAGLASFAADMLMRGTGRRSFEQIYEEIESVGASLDFGSGRHTTSFSGGGLAEDLGLILEMTADCLREPTFPEDQLEAVRGEIITGLQMRANHTGRMAGLAFRELLYQDHPYGLSVEGYIDSVSRLGRQELVDFHRHHYGPRGLILAVVGAVEKEAVTEMVTGAFGDWRTDQQPLPDAPPAKRPVTTVRTQVEMAEKTQSDIVLGLPGPLRSAEDYLEASVANTILGVFGMYGRLGTSLREEQGLAYYAYSRLQGGLGPSPWLVATGVAPDRVEQAIESILAEIRRLQSEPIPPEELADTQAYRTGSMPVSLETSDGLAGVMVDMELYDLGLDYLQHLPDRINGMTPESVQAAARRYLSAEQIAIAVAGPPQ
jgi:zinc protease